MKDLNWNIYFNDRYSQYQERLMALDTMPTSEERTELLRNYVRECKKTPPPSKIREVSFLLAYRCSALNTMFYDHCSDNEIKQFATINEHLYNATQHMYERTNMAKDCLQTMSTWQIPFLLHS